MKQKPSNIPKMKGSTMKDLDKYNEDFKRFKERLIGKMLNTDNTIKAYLHWLDLGLLRALKADGQKQKMLARWQLRAKLVLKQTEKDPKKTQQTPPLEQLKKGAAKLPRETHHQILKELALEGRLPVAIRCQVMEELAKSGVLEGQEFAQAIRKLDMSEMYISRRRALKFKCEITTEQAVQKQTTLLDSGATDCFMDKATVTKLGLRAMKMPHPRKVLNVDGTENKAGQITHYIPLHIQHNKR